MTGSIVMVVTLPLPLTLPLPPKTNNPVLVVAAVAAPVHPTVHVEI